MSELVKRIISAVILLSVYLFGFLYTGAYYIQLFVIGAFIILAGLSEFYRILERPGTQLFKNEGKFYSLLIALVFYLDLLFARFSHLFAGSSLYNLYSENLSFKIALLLVFIMLFHVFFIQISFRKIEGASYAIGASLMGVFYLAIPLSMFFQILSNAAGVYYILFLSLVTIINDSGAYFGGKLFGKTPAGIKASPNKTREGYLFGFAFSVLAALAFNYVWFLDANDQAAGSFVETIILALLISFSGNLGDLAESCLKRDAGVKDSANLIPGHGGILDRVDSLIFTIPVLYIYISLKEVVKIPVFQ